MEILHFCPSRSFSGLEQYAFEMALSQRVRGRDVAFVVCPDTRLEKECKAKGIETILFDPHQPFASLKFWPVLRRLMIRHAEELKVFHLHSTQEVNHIWGAVQAQKVLNAKRPKVILQTHIWINHKKIDPLHRLQYSIVDEVWCSSEAARRSLLKNLPVSEEQVKIVNYGRNIDQMKARFLTREEARAMLALPPEILVVGCVSRIEESKGIREFLSAIKSSLKAHPEVHVAIIGGPSPSNVEAEKYAQDLKSATAAWTGMLKDRVHWLGPVDDSFKYLRAFDLYVLPSYQETFSLALLDAQLAELPVVGSNSGGTPDVVVEGTTGWLFETKNTASLAEKLSAALASQHLWNGYGHTASARVSKDFDQSRVFEVILREYDRKRPRARS